MKKIILLMALLCIVCTSCERVITSSHKEVWHGNITKIDSCGAIDITNHKGITQTWMVGDSIDDIFYEVSDGSSTKFSLGDEVFIHANCGNILASKVSIKDAKTINSRLTDCYFTDNHWIFIMFVCCFIGTILFFIAKKTNKTDPYLGLGVIVIGLTVIITILYTVINQNRLFYQDEGVVTQITDNTVMLDNQKCFNVYSLESFNDNQKNIQIGDKVYAYKYNHDKEKKGGTTFLATDKLTDATITTYQVYPEFWLYNILLLVASGIASFLLFFALDFIDYFISRKTKSKK